MRRAFKGCLGGVVIKSRQQRKVERQNGQQDAYTGTSQVDMMPTYVLKAIGLAVWNGDFSSIRHTKCTLIVKNGEHTIEQR